MIAAHLSRPAAHRTIGKMSLPPGPRGPHALHTVIYVYWTLPYFDWCARRYGDPFTLHLPGFGDYVMLSRPEHIKQVFTGDPAELQAGKANEILRPVVGGNSVLLLDGKEHLRQRRLLLPPMHGERMHAYGELMSEIAAHAVERLPDERFALHPHMQTITLEVILRAVFGLEEGAAMHDLAALLTEFMKPPPSLLVFLPPKLLPYTDVPFSPYRTFLRRRDRVDAMLRAIIRARQAAPVDGKSDILSLLFQARDEEGRPMSEDELRDELVTMLVAGHETTATALTWAFAFILAHPEVEARLRAELEATGGDPAAIASNEYLDGVVKEVLRLRPIVPDVVRRVERPMTVAGYEIPVGAYLTPCIHLAHRRPESWPEPDRFLPERFIGARIDPYAWLPFGGGVRRCLGMAFALYEMKIVLGVMLLRARLALGTHDPLRVVRRALTLAPAGGLPVVVKERKAARIAA
jgi:cytochrome P450